MDMPFFISNILPIATTVGLFVIGWFLKGIDKRFEQNEKRIDRLEDKMSDIDRRLGKIEGLLEGYFARPRE
jgi:hypothetical protein